MAFVEDLIDFDIIETQKENIQSLPQGRSAKALVSAFGPPSLISPAPTPGATRNLNDAIRQEYELELIAISDSDDPLDIYDRYVKWTLNAYPSAQATPESQLRPLLERATKAFQTVPHYKNDPRYLKLWLHYIRLFSDAPKETFAYLARHNIGEGLALFYEEFAAWLEGAGRRTQAEEVYKLGIEREARPAERLLRKFGEFQHRFESRTRDSNEPSSPALPTVRPALVAKLDPFALSTPRPSDAQAQRLPSALPSTSRNGRQKLAIFSDADAPTSVARSTMGDTSKGWDNIGSIQDRKKENLMEARPWAGETLKVGKRLGGPPKMMVFKDESTQRNPETKSHVPSVYTDQQQVVNPRTGKTERVFVNLDAVYPNPNDPNEEYSFEELRARYRGWLDRDWSLERRASEEKKSDEIRDETRTEDELNNTEDSATAHSDHQEPNIDDEGADYTVSDPATLKEGSREGRSSRPRRKKIMEVKVETQTIKTNLDSPTGPKLRRKASAEPTMTINTRAATDDILDIFNQPLRNLGPLGSHADSGGESDYDDDDYTSAGESTGTGRISGTTSEFGDDETGVRSVAIPDVSNPKSVSEWSEFTASKHVPKADGDETEDDVTGYTGNEGIIEDVEGDIQALVTPVSPKATFETRQTKYIPIPPEDYEAPSGPYRDPLQISQNRLPFMTPIVEKTESSIGLPTVGREKDYFTSKTPSRRRGDATPLIPEADDNLLSSPFQEIVNEAKTGRQKKAPPKELSTSSKPSTSTTTPKGPIIKDLQCNPVDGSIRKTILANISPPLSSFPSYHDHCPLTFAKAPELRKFVKALAKVSKNAADKTTTNLSMPPTLTFPNSTTAYTIKRELGKGAFAPVYLAEETATDNQHEGALVAIKAEYPPTAWEFYIMSMAHTRLFSNRASASLLRPLALHLFADEGYLLEVYHPQPTLLDAVNLYRAAHLPSSTSPSPLGLDEPLAMFFAIELLRTLEALHSVQILHGDLKADNCLLRLPFLSDADWNAQYDPLGSNGWAEKGILLIDWGRGIDMKMFREDVGFIADWKTGRGDCVEMREMRPWTWQVDYWGVAAVVHVLLFGKEIADVVEKAASNSTSSPGEVDALTAGLGGVSIDEGAVGVAAAAGKKYRLKDGLKRYWATDVWTALFNTLMNPGHWTAGEEGGKMPLQNRLRDVRGSMESWLFENGERRGLKTGLRRLEELVKAARK